MASDDAPGGSNADQAAFWNSDTGSKWVEYRGRLDASMRPVADLLLRRAAPRPGEAVLDVGCGTGATSRAFAAAVGPRGRVVGVDISEVLLAAARQEAGSEGIDYRLADAQTAAFDGPGFDLVASRFGVMFFADPVAAFRNLGAALRPGGRAVLVTWAELAANPWFRIPRDAAVVRLGAMPPDPPGAPGPFGLADRARGLDILARAGFSECRAMAETLDFVQEGSVEDAAAFAANFGPSVRIVRERGGTAEDVTAIAAAIAEGLAPYAVAGGVRVPATVNVFEAIRPFGAPSR